VSLHLLQAIFFSLWAVLMLRLYRRAHRLHQTAAQRQRNAAGIPAAASAAPMAVRIQASHR
jgi:hypothetical protein